MLSTMEPCHLFIQGWHLSLHPLNLGVHSAQSHTAKVTCVSSRSSPELVWKLPFQPLRTHLLGCEMSKSHGRATWGTVPVHTAATLPAQSLQLVAWVSHLEVWAQLNLCCRPTARGTDDPLGCAQAAHRVMRKKKIVVLRNWVLERLLCRSRWLDLGVLYATGERRTGGAAKPFWYLHHWLHLWPSGRAAAWACHGWWCSL